MTGKCLLQSNPIFFCRLSQQNCISFKATILTFLDERCQIYSRNQKNLKPVVEDSSTLTLLWLLQAIGSPVCLRVANIIYLYIYSIYLFTLQDINKFGEQNCNLIAVLNIADFVFKILILIIKKMLQHCHLSWINLSKK